MIIKWFTVQDKSASDLNARLLEDFEQLQLHNWGKAILAATE
jgi:hypothetical protein